MNACIYSCVSCCQERTRYPEREEFSQVVSTQVIIVNKVVLHNSFDWNYKEGEINKAVTRLAIVF